jgi:hypothetical protein
MGTGKRIVTVVVGAFLLFNATVFGIQLVTGGADPGGPRSSSYTTDDDGIRAWADLLALRGRRVTRLRETLADADLDPDATLVVADPDRLETDDQEAVARFLAGGGRLVLVGSFSAPLLGPDVAWESDGAERVEVGGDDAGDARVLEGDGRGSFTGDLGPGIEPVGTGDNLVVVAAGPAAGGRVVAVADSSLLHNDHLAEADNAAFALALAGDADRPVHFLESVHGYGAASGLGALPQAAKSTLIGLLVAALVGVWCAGQRFGPPEERARRLPPPRRAYVDAMAVSLARSGDPVSAVEPLRRSARQAWADRLTPARTDPATAARGDGPLDPQAAAAAGLGPDELAALDRPSSSADGLLALGRAAARLHDPTVPRPGGPTT